jgi:drug/metabolite transporter (DMT)-like permease
MTGAALGHALALTSALVWGTGDFIGGAAVRRASPYQVLVWSAVSGMVLLLVGALVAREPLPPASASLWAAASGLSGCLGISCLYTGLARGRAATVAPTAGVVTAALPVIASLLTSGRPGMLQLAGFACAALGIWFVARAPGGGGSGPSGFGLAVLAGIGFGGFLVLIARVPPHLVFLPLAISRTIVLIVVTVITRARGERVPSPWASPLALLAGTCDASGNIFYVLARRSIRVDVAAVLSSLYPVATVLLAWLIAREVIGRTQWLGALLCAAAVALIT